MSEGWDDILDADENIVWQGQPVGGIKFQHTQLFRAVFGLIFAGFALIWMAMAAMAGGFFWMFGLLHFSVGIGLAIGPFLWPAVMAKRTWYTLTNQRAFIARKSILGQRSLKSYPIDKTTVIEWVPGDTATINFANESRRGRKGRRYSVVVGFQDIDNGTHVHKLLRDIQKAAQ